MKESSSNIYYIQLGRVRERLHTGYFFLLAVVGISKMNFWQISAFLCVTNPNPNPSKKKIKLHSIRCSAVLYGIP